MSSYAFAYQAKNKKLLSSTDVITDQGKKILVSEYVRVINKAYFAGIPPSAILAEFELSDLCSGCQGSVVVIFNLFETECQGSFLGTVWHVLTINNFVIVAKSVQSVTNPQGSANIQSRLNNMIDPRTGILLTDAAIIFSDIIAGNREEKFPRGAFNGVFRDNQQLDFTDYPNSLSITSLITIRELKWIAPCCKLQPVCFPNATYCSQNVLSFSHGSYQYPIKGQNDYDYLNFGCKSLSTSDYVKTLNRKFNAGIPPEATAVQAEIFDFCDDMCGTVTTFFAAQEVVKCPNIGFLVTIWEIFSLPKGVIVVKTVPLIPPSLPDFSGNIIARHLNIEVPIAFVEQQRTVLRNVVVTNIAPRVSNIIGGTRKYKHAKGFMQGLTAQNTDFFLEGIITFSGDFVIYFE